MDIDEIKREYPFLKTVLAAYEEYDQPVAKEAELQSFYKSNVTYHIGNDKEKYKHICIKLLRNLELLKNKGLHAPNNLEYCTYLYHWLYKETKGRNISDTLISIIFDDFHKKMAGLSEQTICPYALYKKELYESKNLAKLSYLEHNFDNIKEILKNTSDKHYCSCQKYMKDCVDIYRDVKEELCTKGEGKTIYNGNICHELKQFEFYYLFITKDREIEKKAPDLYSGIRKEELSNCPSNKEASASVRESPVNTDASKSNISSAVISSMVGIPPFLALIYKFTPAGKLFRFGNKKHTIITSDFDKKMENELFHVMQKDSNMKDIHSKYNIGYEPV